MNVEVITIGDELLIGQVVDTNSAWMGRELNESGFDVSRKTAISDDASQISEALDEALSRVDVVLITGGLGPTRDDITKKTLCDYFNTKLVFNEQVLEDIQSLLAGRVKNLNSLNRDQALVPESCTVIRNPVGTAPIMCFDKGEKVVVSMPGVPSEMQKAMSDAVIPMLKKRFATTEILHKTILTNGIPEAVLAEKISNWEDGLPEYVKLAYLPAYGRVRLRLSAKGRSKEMMEKAIGVAVEELKGIIGASIWGYDDQLPEVVIGELLAVKGQTLACAESCSGGKIAHLLSSVPGASKYFKGGIVAYANSVKVAALNVEESDLETLGAVSKTVVEQMALGAKMALGVDWAVATSGIAGPDGGSDDKPVGTVWIAWAGPMGVESEVFSFGKIRERNVIRTSETALIGLLKRLKCLNL